MILTGFAPIFPAQPKVMILGSMPGDKSLKRQQYYGHPRNAFWFIMGELFGASPELDYVRRCEILREKGILLWDVLKHCQREGSLDSAIVASTEIANDIPKVLHENPGIRAIFCNGKKSEQTFRKYILKAYPHLVDRIEVISLPSTSPAYASLRPEQKLEQWKAILRYL